MSHVSVFPYGILKILLLHLEERKSSISNTHISTQVEYEQRYIVSTESLK